MEVVAGKGFVRQHSMKNKTPVAFFAYNRPQHTERALLALSKSRRLEDCDFYFFSDAAKSEAARAKVAETREVLRYWAQVLNATVLEREANIGLARSISSGVSDLCLRYGRAVVIEDDLIVSPDFLHFMIESLDRYEDEPSVVQVGGFTINPPEDPVGDAFLLPVTTTWGWATWQRAWEGFSLDLPDLDAARGDGEWMRLFNFDGSSAYTVMLEDRIAGRNDSWGILWWFAVSRKRGLVVYPSRSLVWNGGFDGSGVHCGSDDFLGQGDVALYVGSALPERLSFPAQATFEESHFRQLKDFFWRTQTPAALSPMHATGVVASMKTFARRVHRKLFNAFS
ncbi:hemolysin activation protein [Rhizobium sp. BR 314]|uniref:hemolysin activation protein n=1 Tax=Rhizobium sp. BR 314 TaxID=3040013 RepID=UPI0039BF2B68